MVSNFRQYRRKHIAELRPYVPGEDLSGVSISAPDKEGGSPKVGDMIARNPKNHKDQWLVAEQYFKDNFEPVEAAPQPSGTMRPLDENDYEEIISAAAINMRRATSGIRGQMITVQDCLDWWVMKETERRILSALTADKPHPDDEAVDRFAAAMKAKLKWEREERGRHGWNDPSICPESYLARLLIEHLAKGNDGNFEDVANFCMMLHQRGAHPRVLADALTAGKPETDYFGSLVERARASAAKASAKFPQPNYVTLKIAEEAGEVVRGAVHYAERRMEWSEVEGEIIQLLAMLIRFVTEGDQVNGIVPPTAGGDDE